MAVGYCVVSAFIMYVYCVCVYVFMRMCTVLFMLCLNVWSVCVYGYICMCVIVHVRVVGCVCAFVCICVFRNLTDVYYYILCLCVGRGGGLSRMCLSVCVFVRMCLSVLFCAYVLICMYLCVYVLICMYFCAHVLTCTYLCSYVSSEFSIYLSIMTFRYTHWKTHADDRQQNSLWKPLYRVKAHQFCIFQSCALIKRRKQSDYIKRGWQMTLHAKSH